MAGMDSRAVGFRSRTEGAPDHNVLSVRCNRSRAAPPKTMAPSRPFPTGKACSQRSAGCANHIGVFLISGMTRPRGSVAAAIATSKKSRRFVFTRVAFREIKKECIMNVASGGVYVHDTKITHPFAESVKIDLPSLPGRRDVRN